MISTVCDEIMSTQSGIIIKHHERYIYYVLLYCDDTKQIKQKQIIVNIINQHRPIFCTPVAPVAAQSYCQKAWAYGAWQGLKLTGQTKQALYLITGR
jgi:hypothetical protein